MEQLKDCGKMSIRRSKLKDGTLIYETVEETGSYFGQPNQVTTTYTRTHTPFDYTLESELQRPVAQS